MQLRRLPLLGFPKAREEDQSGGQARQGSSLRAMEHQGASLNGKEFIIGPQVAFPGGQGVTLDTMQQGQ